MSKIEKTLFSLFITKELIVLFFTPYLEYPDSIAHLMRIQFYTGEKINLYYWFLNKIYQISEIMGLDNRIIYLYKNIFNITLSNKMFVIYQSYIPAYLLFGMIFQLVMVILSIYLFYFILAKDKEISENLKHKFFKIILLWYSMISISFLVLNITSDYMVYIYQPFFLYFLYKKKYILNLILCFLILKYIDNNILANIFFMYFYIVLKFMEERIKNKKKFLFFSIIFLLINIIILFPLGISLSEQAQLQRESNLQLGSGKLYTKIAGIFLSSFYLGGFNQYLTFKILYIIYILFVIKIVVKIIENKKGITEFFSIIGSVSAMMYVVRNLGHIKYFTYINLFIIEYVFLYVFKDKSLKNTKLLNKIGIIFFVLTLFEVFKLFFKAYIFIG